MSLAPIALFVYNRLEHTKRTVSALQNNELSKDSDLIIFSDAAKNESGLESVRGLRNYLKKITGFKSLEIIERQENFGLAKSIISGVTEVVNRYGKIIVLEDDLLTSPYFLDYMNKGLDLYENNDEVISIHAYIYPVKDKLPETFFLKGADCWGLATWKRGWDLFESDGQKLLNELESRKLIKEFNWNGAYPYNQMLKGQIFRFNNSWAIRWHASAFLKNKLTLYPGESLVSNSGLDSSGTHTSSHGSELFVCKVKNTPVKLESLEIKEDEEALKKIIKHFNAPKMRLLTIAIRLKFFYKIIKKYVKGNR